MLKDTQSAKVYSKAIPHVGPDGEEYLLWLAVPTAAVKQKINEHYFIEFYLF